MLRSRLVHERRAQRQRCTRRLSVLLDVADEQPCLARHVAATSTAHPCSTLLPTWDERVTAR